MFETGKFLFWFGIGWNFNKRGNETVEETYFIPYGWMTPLHLMLNEEWNQTRRNLVLCWNNHCLRRVHTACLHGASASVLWRTPYQKQEGICALKGSSICWSTEKGATRSSSTKRNKSYETMAMKANTRACVQERRGWDCVHKCSEHWPWIVR